MGTAAQWALVLVGVGLAALGAFELAVGVCARAGRASGRLALPLPVEAGSARWERAHRAAWPVLFAGGVLGASQGTALAATALMWPQGALSVCAVLAVSGLVVEAGLWRVAGAAARSSSAPFPGLRAGGSPPPSGVRLDRAARSDEDRRAHEEDAQHSAPRQQGRHGLE